MTYNQIFTKYGSDKGDIKHRYGPFYEKHLLNNPPKKLLEIGVLEGASLMAWREIFPNAEIHGLDLFSEWPEGITYYGDTINEDGWHGLKLWRGDQTDKEILHLLRKEKFDVIIDDGSHNTREVMMTFFGLAHPGCRYFIEDVNCSNQHFYNQGLPSIFHPDMLFADSRYEYDYIMKGAEVSIMLIKC